MGDEDVVYTPSRERDYGNGVENYECEGCRSNAMGCGECPHNEDRIREYNRKYVR